MSIKTVRELFLHADWARDRLFRLAADLPDDRLDRPFEMGPGSLRETLKHIYGAERIWSERVGGPGHERHPQSAGLARMDEAGSAARGLAADRDRWLKELSADALRQDVTYRNLRGETYANALGDILIHINNHAAHHRAQAVNMLRHLGVKPPGLDYLFMHLRTPAQPPGPPAPAVRTFEIEPIRRFFAYGDWATSRVLDAAKDLDDESLDRPFEMGLGSLRRTLVHIHDAEQWWIQNWLGTLPQVFDQTDPRIGLADLRDAFTRTAAARERIVSSLSDGHLSRQVSAQPSPGEVFQFALGDTMLQLCVHGTHHRAQALNMLRRLGTPTPGLDYILWARERMGD